MKKKSILAIVALVLAFAGTQSSGYNVAEFPICTNDANQINPAINGSIIVWQDYRNGNWDIYGYDLSTQTEFPICVNSADQISPDISGNLVVWEDYRYDSAYQDFHCSIYGYELSTRTEFLIYHTTNSRQRYPAIDGNFVVWVENYPLILYRINGYSLSGHTKFIIYDNSSYEPLYYPVAVSGSIVVWMSMIGGGNYDQVRSYDFYNHTFLPTSGTIYGLYPKISGSIVVYGQCDSTPCVEYLYKICYTDFSKQCLGPFGVPGPCSHCLTYSDPNQCLPNMVCRYMEGSNPDISGNIIVWGNQYRGAYVNAIYGYDISTRTWFSISEISKWPWPTNPVIDGNIVIWQDRRNGNWDIYGARLEPFCLEKPEMDFNGDCKVDFADFAIMALHWLEHNNF